MANGSERSRRRQAQLAAARSGEATPARSPSRRADEARPVEKFLARLKNVASCGDGWSARCPAHNDHQNSLSVGEGEDGRVLLYCHAGCSVEDVLDELEISMGHL